MEEDLAPMAVHSMQSPGSTISTYNTIDARMIVLTGAALVTQTGSVLTAPLRFLVWRVSRRALPKSATCTSCQALPAREPCISTYLEHRVQWKSLLIWGVEKD